MWDENKRENPINLKQQLSKYHADTYWKLLEKERIMNNVVIWLTNIMSSLEMPNIHRLQAKYQYLVTDSMDESIHSSMIET